MHSKSNTPEEYHLCIHGQLFARLYEPQWEEMFWCSYSVEPIHPAASDILRQPEMWINTWFDIKAPDGEGYHSYTFAGGSFPEYCHGDTDRFSFRSLFPGVCDPPAAGQRFVDWLRCCFDFLFSWEWTSPLQSNTKQNRSRWTGSLQLTTKQNRIRWCAFMKPPDGDPDTTDSASEYIEPVIGREADVRKRIDKALPSIEWSSECGVYNREGCTFEFSLSAQRGHVNEIWVHVDGPRNTDIFPLLCDLAGANGWILQDCQTRKVIDQQTPSRDGWDKVHNFRERVETAIETMQRA